MKTVKGTWKNGQIVLDKSTDWPEGCRVLIRPVDVEQSLGIRDEDWPTDAEGIAQLLARMDSMEPLEMTPEELAEWEAARREQKEFEKKNFDKWTREIGDLFR